MKQSEDNKRIPRLKTVLRLRQPQDFEAVPKLRQSKALHQYQDFKADFYTLLKIA